MDVTLLPKLAAAGIVGATAATYLDRSQAPSETTILRLEWIQSNPKVSESLILRTLNDQPTIVRQGDRKIIAQTMRLDQSHYTVSLNITTDGGKEAPQNLTTNVSLGNGETVVVMGTTQKTGKSSNERLFFLTANPL